MSAHEPVAMPMADAERISASLAPATHEPLMEAWNIRKYFPIRGGVLSSHIGDVKAVDGISLSINRGETVGLVGESGCGKTTVGRMILRLIEPTSGHVFYRPSPQISERLRTLYTQMNDIQRSQKGRDPDAALSDPRLAPIVRELDGLASKYSLFRMKGSALQKLRGQMQIVFQDPFSSLSPRMLVKDIIAEPMAIHHIGTRIQRQRRVAEIMADVGLNPEHLWRFPHEFSGGQRQRIGIARAIALKPEFIVLDEPTSALDVSVQAQILNILLKLQREHMLSYLFVSHHLSVVRAVSHKVVVMYLGKVAEFAPTEELFSRPLHPYTQALLSAIPIPDPSLVRKRIILKGDVPSPASPPKGCRFHTRCPMVMPICSQLEPSLLPVPKHPKHLVACHLYTEGAVSAETVSAVAVFARSLPGDTASLGEKDRFANPPPMVEAEALSPPPPSHTVPPPILSALPPSGRLDIAGSASSISVRGAATLPPPLSRPVVQGPTTLPPQQMPLPPPPPPPPPVPRSSYPSPQPLPSVQRRPETSTLPSAPAKGPPLRPPPGASSFNWRRHPLIEDSLSADATLSPSIGKSLKDRFRTKP